MMSEGGGVGWEPKESNIRSLESKNRTLDWRVKNDPKNLDIIYECSFTKHGRGGNLIPSFLFCTNRRIKW